VGRTLQVFNRFRVTRDFEAGKPWLLRFFDQIRFYPVAGEELLEMRAAFAAGRLALKTEEEVFDLARYNRSLSDNAASIAEFKDRQQLAFDAERRSWAAQGLASFSAADEATTSVDDAIPEGSAGASSSVPGSLWKLEARPGQRVRLGQRLAVIESMKMEIAVLSPRDGVVSEVRATEGMTVAAGQALIVVT
jgi:urea carboxylase